MDTSAVPYIDVPRQLQALLYVGSFAARIAGSNAQLPAREKRDVKPRTTGIMGGRKFRPPSYAQDSMERMILSAETTTTFSHILSHGTVTLDTTTRSAPAKMPLLEWFWYICPLRSSTGVLAKPA